MRNKYTIDIVKKHFERLNCTLVSTEYTNITSPLKFICNNHKENGIQETCFKNVLRNQSCHICGKNKSMYSKSLTPDKIKKITEASGFLYVDCGYNSDNTRNVFFKCPNHLDKGIQETTVINIKNRKGKCYYCLNKDRDHLSFCKEISKLNPNIIVLNEYKNTNTKILCRCNICNHEWSNSAKNLLYGQGCKRCSSRLSNLKRKHTNDWFVQKMSEIHPNIIPLQEYKTIKTPIQCKCKICNYTWDTTPDALINAKSGCYKCSCKKIGLSSRKSHSDFLKELSIINPNIILLENYTKRTKKILCKCKIHNYTWKCFPYHLISRNTGCPICSLYSNEIKIKQILEKWGYRYTLQKRFDDCRDKHTLPFDFYLDDFNTCIEYDGEQHYYPIPRSKNITHEDAEAMFFNIQKHDFIKTNYCKKNKIKLIRIPYYMQNDLEYFLFDQFVKKKIIIEIKK